MKRKVSRKAIWQKFKQDYDLSKAFLLLLPLIVLGGLSAIINFMGWFLVELGRELNTVYWKMDNFCRRRRT